MNKSYLSLDYSNNEKKYWDNWENSNNDWIVDDIKWLFLIFKHDNIMIMQLNGYI